MVILGFCCPTFKKFYIIKILFLLHGFYIKNRKGKEKFATRKTLYALYAWQQTLYAWQQKRILTTPIIKHANFICLTRESRPKLGSWIVYSRRNKRKELVPLEKFSYPGSEGADTRGRTISIWGRCRARNVRFWKENLG